MEHERSTLRINLLNILFIIACVGLLALLFTGCSSTAQPPTGPSPVALLARSLAPASPDSMHVFDSTYQRTRKLFDDNFTLSSGKPIQLTEQEIAWDDLADLIPPGTGHLHALRFDFGLEVDSMRFGISVLELDPTADPAVFTYTVPDSLHALQQRTLRLQDASKWRKDLQYDTSDPAVYFSGVRVRHKAGGTFGPLDYAEDARANVLAWDDELLLLRNENAAGHGDSTFSAVLRCISKPDEKDDLRHRIAVHLRLRPKGVTAGPYRDLLDNTLDRVNLFRMHGADFGNMCPPGSFEYHLPPR